MGLIELREPKLLGSPGNLSCMSVDRIERRARALSGLPPVRTDLGKPWWKRLLTNRWTYLVTLLLLTYVAALWDMHRFMSLSMAGEIEAVTQEMGSPVTVTQAQINEAMFDSAKWASLTLLAWVLIFFFVDRWRRTKFVMKVLALGWGIAIATWVSLYVNSWMGTLIGIEGAVDSSAAARSAIFVAPFVEEASKATILFLLAIAIRYRFVSVFQSVSLAGLSAVGFAFTENIIYYTRTYMYASKIIGDDPEAARMALVFLRGLATSWGHPLFTAATAIGLAVGLRSRAKFVRILAPLAGFAFAVTGHMAFNGLASLGAPTTTMVIYGLLVLLFLVIWLFRRNKAERALLQARLGDFVQMGWLTSKDVAVMTRGLSRLKLAVAGLLRGPKVFRDTIGLQRSFSELAYLRSMMAVGIVDGSGDERMAELLAKIRLQRVLGLDDPVGLKIKPENWKFSNLPFVRRFREWQASRSPQPVVAPVHPQAIPGNYGNSPYPQPVAAPQSAQARPTFPPRS